MAVQWNEELGEKSDSGRRNKILAMIPLLRHFVGWLVGAFRSREDLCQEDANASCCSRDDGGPIEIAL